MLLPRQLAARYALAMNIATVTIEVAPQVADILRKLEQLKPNLTGLFFILKSLLLMQRETFAPRPI